MFFNYFFKFIKKFGSKYKTKLIFLSFCSLFMGIIEFSGLCLILPFMLLLTQKESFISSKFCTFFTNLLPFLHDDNIIVFFAITILALYIIKNIAMILYVKYQNKVISDWLFDIYKKVLNKLLFCPFNIANKFTKGEKLTLLNSVIGTSVWGFMQKSILFLSNVLIASCILFYLFCKFTYPALITSLFLCTCIYFEHLFFKNRAKRFGSEILNLSKEYQTRLQYLISALKEIKVSECKDYFASYLTGIYKNLNTVTTHSNSNGTYPLYVTEIIIVLSFAVLVSSMLLTSYTESSLMVSSLAVVCAVVLRLVPLLNKMHSCLYSINSSKSALIWFLESYDAISKFNEYTENTGAKSLVSFNNSIVLKDVYFKYDEGTFELKNINLEIKKGEFIGIVGPSGSGKSTLADILTCIYEPVYGNMYIDDVKIDNTNSYSWQKHLVILPQEFTLMPSSVKQNVAWGITEEDMDIDKISYALKEAQIFNEISDINSKINYSHGQKHRIALARAIYKNADVIFLDEATSSLDIETEDKVSNSIAAFKGKKTVIAIAHRLSTLKKCDKIIYMKEGTIIDTGSFAQLKSKYPDFEHMLKISSFEPV